MPLTDNQVKVKEYIKKKYMMRYYKLEPVKDGMRITDKHKNMSSWDNSVIYRLVGNAIYMEWA